MQDFIKPEYKLGTPPKEFNKWRSLGVFACATSDFRCPEILRATITTSAEIYLSMPYAKGMDFHLSYQTRGRFHLKLDGKYLYPETFEDDFRRTLEFLLRIREYPCFCLRIDRRLAFQETEALVRIVRRYLPFEFDTEEVSRSLSVYRFRRFVSKAGARC